MFHLLIFWSNGIKKLKQDIIGQSSQLTQIIVGSTSI